MATKNLQRPGQASNLVAAAFVGDFRHEFTGSDAFDRCRNAQQGACYGQRQDSQQDRKKTEGDGCGQQGFAPCRLALAVQDRQIERRHQMSDCALGPVDDGRDEIDQAIIPQWLPMGKPADAQAFDASRQFHAPVLRQYSTAFEYGGDSKSFPGVKSHKKKTGGLRIKVPDRIDRGRREKCGGPLRAFQIAVFGLTFVFYFPEPGIGGAKRHHRQQDGYCQPQNKRASNGGHSLGSLACFPVSRIPATHTLRTAQIETGNTIQMHANSGARACSAAVEA